MKKFILFLLLIANSLGAQDIVGFWKTINEKTNKPESLVAIYEYQGKYYGRIIATYGPDGNIQDTISNPKERAPGVEGNPYYVGLDFIWNLSKDGSEFTDGQILDPEQGNVYDATMWLEGNNLVVRGQLMFIGKNQEWLPATDKDFPPNLQKPDLAQLKPKIPKVKKPQPSMQKH